MAHHGWVPVVDEKTLTPDGLKSPFGRLFPPTDHVYDSFAIALLAGARGPLEDRRPDRLAAGQSGPTVDDNEKRSNPAGFTFLGQFIDHDLTEFRVISDGLRINPVNPTIGQRQLVLEDVREAGLVPTTTNGRTGKLDLDSVYGLLGVAQGDLFLRDGRFRLRGGRDLLRRKEFRHGRLIADPRNDENKLVAQVHILFERLHNAIHAPKPGGAAKKGPGGPAFDETRRAVQAIYRAIVLNDYLPRIVAPKDITAVAGALVERQTFYQRMNARNRAALRDLGLPEREVLDTVAMPVEFSHAVFRLGHSQLRNSYGMQPGKGAPLFAPGVGNGKDLRGNQPITAEFVVDWNLFFGPGAQPGLPLDTLLPAAIFRLPPPAIGEPPVSLAERNIRRGIDFGLPSGQEVAAQLMTVYGHIHVLPFQRLFERVDVGAREVFDQDASIGWRTPLWYYMLREAELLPPIKSAPVVKGTDGRPIHFRPPQLGAVGGLIVAETLLGSLAEVRLAEARAARHPGLDGGATPLPEGEETEILAAFAEEARAAAGGEPDGLVWTGGPPADPGKIRSMAQLVGWLAAHAPLPPIGEHDAIPLDREAKTGTPAEDDGD